MFLKLFTLIDSLCPSVQFSFRHTLGFFCFLKTTTFSTLTEHVNVFQFFRIFGKTFQHFDSFQLSEIIVFVPVNVNYTLKIVIFLLK